MGVEHVHVARPPGQDDPHPADALAGDRVALVQGERVAGRGKASKPGGGNRVGRQGDQPRPERARPEVVGVDQAPPRRRGGRQAGRVRRHPHLLQAHDIPGPARERGADGPEPGRPVLGHSQQAPAVEGEDAQGRRGRGLSGGVHGWAWWRGRAVAGARAGRMGVCGARERERALPRSRPRSLSPPAPPPSSHSLSRPGRRPPCGALLLAPTPHLPPLRPCAHRDGHRTRTRSSPGRPLRRAPRDTGELRRSSSRAAPPRGAIERARSPLPLIVPSPTMEDVQLRRLHVETSVRPAAGPGGGGGAGGPGGAGLGRVGGRGGERARQAGRGAQSACFRRSRSPPPALSVRGTAARPARRRPPTRMQGQGQAPTSHSLGGDGLGPGPGPPRAAARGCGVIGLSRRPPRALSLTLSLPSTPSSQPRPPTSPPSPPASPAPR